MPNVVLTADGNPECSCKKCQSACTYRPGFFRADQIEPLAKALNMGLEAFFKEHLQIDYWRGGIGDDDSDVFMLVPRLKGEQGGTQVDSDPRGTCHWYLDGGCAIHALGKPAECAALYHDENGKQISGDREAIVATWINHQDLIAKLNDGEPYPHEDSMMSMFSLMSMPYYPRYGDEHE